MSTALIGHTGFVGGNLRRQASFAELYSSSNIESIRGRSFELLVCSGARAEKWKANAEPEADKQNLGRLTACLREVQADHVVVISTVDVYPHPIEVDEDTTIELGAATPYGRHRRELELFLQDRFDTTTLRLPALFGPGLKKNVVYDFLHQNQLEAICPDGVFQFYSVEGLWKDIGKAREHGIKLLNVSTEPMSVRRIAREAFGFEFDNPVATRAARYDMRSKYDMLFGGGGGYLYRADEVLSDLRGYVESQRS